jgi:membrane protein YqaA with SNARE-associated domain
MNLAALAWGFAEATLFFVVPDVLLTWVALRGARPAWLACLWALVGALGGGTVMYLWGESNFGAASAAVERVPAVSPTMCDAVGEQIRTYGVVALFLGAIAGTPYKIYAVQAGAAHLGLALFLFVSVPARLFRFAGATGLAILICRLVPAMKLSVRRIVHIALWTTFYGWYFWHFGAVN